MFAAKTAFQLSLDLNVGRPGLERVLARRRFQLSLDLNPVLAALGGAVLGGIAFQLSLDLNGIVLAVLGLAYYGDFQLSLDLNGEGAWLGPEA